MINLGVKRKELYAGSEVKKDYDTEVVFPEVSVDGKQAEKMGAADISDGESFTATVQFKVKRLVKTVSDGKTSYSLTLCLEKMSDLEEVDGDVDDDLEGEELPTTSALRALEPAGYGSDD